MDERRGLGRRGPRRARRGALAARAARARRRARARRGDRLGAAAGGADGAARAGARRRRRPRPTARCRPSSTRSSPAAGRALTELGNPIHPQAIAGVDPEPGAVEADALLLAHDPQIGFDAARAGRSSPSSRLARSPQGGDFLDLDYDARERGLRRGPRLLATRPASSGRPPRRSRSPPSAPPPTSSQRDRRRRPPATR